MRRIVKSMPKEKIEEKEPVQVKQKAPKKKIQKKAVTKVMTKVMAEEKEETPKTKTKTKTKAKTVKELKEPKVAKESKTTKAKTKISRASAGEYKLVIVESPVKAKTIKKYLGRGFEVVASNGHIKDLPKSKLGVDLENNFKTDMVLISGKKAVLDKLYKHIGLASHIYLATDPDREGEAIAFHIAEEVIGKKQIYRVLFNEITKNAVLKAMENPIELNEKKYDSQKTRRILDRLVGYKISPILWDKVQRGLSAGRVQSVALRLMVEREDEIAKFKSEQWFSIVAELKKDNRSFLAKYYGETVDKKSVLLDKNVVEQLLNETKERPFIVTDVKAKERKQNPTPPFTTSKLQQEAFNKLGLTAKKTMNVAQKLYEGIEITGQGPTGLITYMRTDSVRTAPEALDDVRRYIAERYGEKFLPATATIYKKKGNSKVQDAHEAIRPASLSFPPESVKNDLAPEEYKLYELIWNKFISSQMGQAIIDQTTVLFNVSGHIFKSTGSVIRFPGFRTVYLEAKLEQSLKKGGGDSDENGAENSTEATETTETEDDGVLPPMSVKEELNPAKGPWSNEHWTAPPPRYTDGSIVKDLEEKGIGRPSTYASIISNIVDRGYVQKIEGRYVPSELGAIVCKMLIESFPSIMDVAFTAHVEDLLDEIEAGSVKWTKVLSDFWGQFEKVLKVAQEEMKNLKRTEIPTGVKCHKCSDGHYFIKWGRNGQFFACSNYPECRSTEDFKRHLDGTYEIIPKEYTKDPCPTCGKRLVVKKGKYGRFVACEEYPLCKTSLPYMLDVQCPKCQIGRFVEKQSRFGKLFYGCSNYPQCNHAMWTMPKSFECVACKSPVMGLRQTKRLGPHLQCPQCQATVLLSETPFASEEKTNSEEN